MEAKCSHLREILNFLKKLQPTDDKTFFDCFCKKLN